MNGSNDYADHRHRPEALEHCNLLLDAGLTYLDCTEQLTYLLFLKMTQEPWNQKSPVPAEFSWTTFAAEDGDAPEAHYRRTLEALGTRPGMLGVIFRKAQK